MPLGPDPVLNSSVKETSMRNLNTQTLLAGLRYTMQHFRLPQTGKLTDSKRMAVASVASP